MSTPAEEPQPKRLTPNRLRQTIYWLTLDWITLRNQPPTLPVQRLQDVARSSNVRDYGHPNEWASDNARDIVDILTSWHQLLAEHRGETPPVKGITTGGNGWRTTTPAPLSEQRRVIAAWRYLEPRIEQLTQIVEPEALQELPDLHHRIRRTLGLTKPRYTLPIPCPNNDCSLRTLTRIHGIGQDFICCDTCGYTVKDRHYPFLIRLSLDALIDNQETRNCTGTVQASSTTVPATPPAT